VFKKTAILETKRDKARDYTRYVMRKFLFHTGASLDKKVCGSYSAPSTVRVCNLGDYIQWARRVRREEMVQSIGGKNLLENQEGDGNIHIGFRGISENRF
jgi:hypothetical protein